MKHSRLNRFLRKTLAGAAISLFLILLATGAAQAVINVTVTGPGGSATQGLPDEGGSFDLNIPLNSNSVNTIEVKATDSYGNSASQELKVTQVSLDSVVVSKVTAHRLSVQEVEQLVDDGVIDLDDPANYHVSTFDIVLSIGSKPVPVSVPIALPKTEPKGWEVYKIPKGGSGGNNKPKTQPPQIVVFEDQVKPAPDLPPVSIPGVIIIEGNVKSLKEFFSVRLLLMNTSGIFTLQDVTAKIEFPDGGLTSISPKDGIISFGQILPGDGGKPGQKEKEYIIRGDEIGVRNVRVNYAGVLTGPGIPEDSPIPFNGSAMTHVEVKGPPTFDIQVNHPDYVEKDVPYELQVDITNTGDIPAMYASLGIDVGADAKLVKCDMDGTGEPVCTDIEGADIRNLGHIMPGERVREIFTIKPLKTGPITSCVGVADQNISLKVITGNIGCIVGEFPPDRIPPDGTPAVYVLPVPNATGIHPDTAVTAFFSELMRESSITTGEGGTFNVFDSSDNLVPGKITFAEINGKTVAIWRVNDGITNSLKGNARYTVVISKDILDLDGNSLSERWQSIFTTTGTGTDDTTLPEITLSVEPPVDPNYVLPGQIIRINTYAVDQGSGVVRVEARLKDMDIQGSHYELIDQKTVFKNDKPPYIFSINSAKLTPGHTYQFMATAYDGAGNVRDSTLSLIIASSADPPTITLPDDPAEPVLQGISVDITPVSVTGGVTEVMFYLDNQTSPFRSVHLAPYQSVLVTLGLPLGTHTVRAVAIDGLGQTGEDTMTFTLVENKNMPVVNFGSSADGANYITGDIIPVSPHIEDPVGIASVKYFLDDPTGTPIATVMAPIALNTSGLSLGTHRVYVIATNNLGISNNPSDPDSYLEFNVVEPPPGQPPDAPVVSNISFPENSVVTIHGSSVANAKIVIVNKNTGATLSVNADSNGNFLAQIDAEIGNLISLVAYDLAQSPDPSPETIVTVPAPPVLDHIEVSPVVMNFDRVNQFQDIKVTGYYQDGSTADLTSKATYSSSDSGIAAVDSSGRVVALSYGDAVVTVSSGGFQQQVTVHCNIITLISITASPTPISLISIGQTQAITVTGHYSDGSSKVLSSGITYTSSDASVVTVNSSGLVTAMGNGQAIITVYTSGVQPLSINANVDTGLDPAPTVKIINPSDGIDVERGDALSVSVDAEDSIGGVTRVYLDVKGETTYSEVRQVSPPSLSSVQNFVFHVSDTATIGKNIIIDVYAEDTSGNVSEISSVTLHVVDNTPPSVSIEAPLNNSPFNYGDTVTVTIHATDAVGVSSIRYETTGALTFSGSMDIVPMGKTANAEFSFTIPYGVMQPDVQIHAYAVDTYGHKGTAVPVSIILTNADITPPETIITSLTDPGAGTTSTITYRVTSGLSDLDHVELYFRRNGIGTFNRYTSASTGNRAGSFFPETGDTGTIVFDSTIMGGDGIYEFYTVGVDKAGNREPAPVDSVGNIVPDGTVTFNSGTVWMVINTPVVIDSTDTSYDNQNLRVIGTTLTVTGHHVFHNMELLQGAVLTHPDTDMNNTYSIDIKTWSLTIDSTSSIDADGRGYSGGLRGGNDCSGQTEGNTDGSTYRSGGSYGGPGGEYGGMANGVYGSLSAPSEAGSGGSCGTYDRAGGDGGGVVHIEAVNIVNDGKITANGDTGSGYLAGSGSGGSVYIVTDTLSGTGQISADGGTGEVGGGGGRIAIYYVDISTIDQDIIHALGGQGSYALAGNGTVFLKNILETNGTLVVDGQGSTTTFSPLPLPAGYIFDNIIIRNNARVVVDDPLVVNGTLRLETGSILTHSVGNEGGLSIEAARVEIDSTSAIDVSGKGYRGGLRDGNTACEGESLGGLSGASYRSGGSYGGYGGVYDGTGSNLPYGGPSEAVYPGSGGSCGTYSRAGGNGGGLVRIKATDAVVVDGEIAADGGIGSGYQAGSGSGGSVYIETSLLSGTGSIGADGGAGEVGGGGGRVYIVYDYTGGAGDDLGGLGNITAYGGHGSYSWGSAGTVLLRRSDQSYGDLYIDDNLSSSTSSVYTPLTQIGTARITALTSDTITTDGAVKMMPNALAGLEIRPDINQDITFRIVSNTENTITVDTSGGVMLTDVAAVGDTYIGVYRFDNVYIQGGGYLVTGDSVVVSDTVKIEEYGKLTHFDTDMNLETGLYLNTGTLLIGATGSIDADGRGYLGGLRGGNDCSGQTEGNTDGSTYRSGGSYGGPGGEYGGVANGVYGSLSAPSEAGSGGSCGTYDRAGGDGGGVVHIEAVNIVNDGKITANGDTGSGYLAGSGSGGSVYIVTDTLSGTGQISADGGAGEVGGGGGRIAIYYNTLGIDQGMIHATGGQGSYVSGGNGSVYLKGP